MGDCPVVRPRPLVMSVLALALVAAADAPDPIERRPYRIEAHIAIEPDARIDARGRDVLLAAWRSLVHRFVGAPWELTIAPAGSTLGAVPLDSLALEDFAPRMADHDKIWVIKIQAEKSGLGLSGREFDVASRRLSSLRRQPARVIEDLPRSLLRFALGLFCPIAEVGEQSGGGVSLRVRGAALEPASTVGRVVAPGTVFEPLRVVPQRDGSTHVLKIPFSYLRVEKAAGADVHCAIVSALRDPLTRRMAGKNTLMALGTKPGDRPTRLQFVTRSDQSPAAGYVLTARPVPEGAPYEVGTTDREGRITLKPGFASGLVILRLIAGSVEPMVELPLMPGESVAERTIPFDPKPGTVTLETQLDSLRDAVIDLVAIRARLEARLKARSDGEDWDGVAATLKEFNNLPSRDTFAKRLVKLKEDAARQQAVTKIAILTKTAQAQVADVQALIDRYLDDEIVRGYADALNAHNNATRKPAAAKPKRRAAAAGKTAMDRAPDAAKPKPASRTFAP